MAQKRKLIVILIDGVSGEYFTSCRARLPYLSALADNGFYTCGLHPEVCATSLPGRTSMITGVAADTHGIYGNKIWGGEDFRYANPDDVRVPTIAHYAKQAGLSVACMGYTMIKPEDSDIFQPPWWVGEWLQRGRDPEPLPLDESWKRALIIKDPNGQLAALHAAGLPDQTPAQPQNDPRSRLAAEMSSDYIMMRWAAGLAASVDAPDVIFTEIEMTDDIQHMSGYKSDAAHWSLSTADMLVGLLITELQRAGRLDDYNIAIASDHGHSTIETAIYPDVVIPGLQWSSEGSMLHVHYQDQATLKDAEIRLAELGAERYSSDHMPEDLRDHIATFAAPAQHSFESKPVDVDDNQATGKPRATSSHGLRPGSVEDHRIAIFSGQNVPTGTIDQASAEQFTPTLAALLGLSLQAYPAAPMFDV